MSRDTQVTPTPAAAGVEEPRTTISNAGAVDLQCIGPLLEGFCSATGIAAALLNPDGDILLASNWQPLCTEFHRVHPETARRCRVSDTELASRLREGETAALYTCGNGLTDIVSPVIVAGEHVANVFVGQFLLEPPDVERFRRQAADCGFDEAAYLRCLGQIPVLTEAKAKAAVQFLTALSELLGGTALDAAELRRVAAQYETGEQRILHLNRLLRMATGINEMMVRVEEPEALCERACSIFVEQGGFSTATIALCDPVTKTLVPSARAGDGAGSPDDITICYDDAPEGQGPEGRAARSGRVVTSSDIASDKTFAPFLKAAPAQHYSSVVALPLNGDGRVRGILALYQAEPREFDDGEVDLLEELASDLSFALRSIEEASARRDMAIALQESEERYRTLVESTPDLILSLDTQGRHTAVNGAACRAFGLAREEIIGKNHAELGFPPEAIAERRSLYARVIAQGESVEAELTAPGPDGTTHIYECVLDPITDDDGRVTGISGRSHDITARRQTQAELQERDERLTALFDNLSGAAYRSSLEPPWRDEFISDGILTVTGYSAEEFLVGGLDWSTLVHADDMDRSWDCVQQAITAGSDRVETEYRVRAKDGSERWILDRAVIIRDAEGAPASLEGLLIDVTARHAAEEGLRVSEERYRTLVENLSEGVFSIDSEGLVDYMSPTAERLLGVKRADVEHLRFLDLIAEDEHDGARALLAEALQHAMPPVVLKMASRNGARRHLSVMSAPSPAGVEPRGVICSCQDVSDQIREQERRHKAEQQRERALVRLRRTVESAARTLAGAVEMRDLYTAGHQDRVTQLVDRLAESLGLHENARAALHIAALIHDLGKLSIPAEILTKPGKLSTLEFDLLRQHSESGYQLVRQMHFPGAVADIVRQHHERLDGSGYPLGLKGDEIRLESRLVAIADVVEAMSSHRPYRPALGIEAALAEIEANRGTLYDPVVADACLALFREEGFAFGHSAAVHLPI